MSTKFQRIHSCQELLDQLQFTVLGRFVEKLELESNETF